jgi:putative PIN family toxin of toxin-antitoxin system
MKIVLDTDVLVSGLISPFGPPARILRLLAAGDLLICYDARIIAEYHDVLNRQKFGFNRDSVEWLLDYFVQNGQAVAAVPLAKPLPDADDEAFLEVAFSGQADALVTGNLSHFPKRFCGKINVLSPADFLAFYQK